jgi:hypothetical protein
METAVPDRNSIYWHRYLPPLGAEFMAEHTVEADSSRVAGTLSHRDELWGRCYGELMASAEARLIQEIVRLGGDYAHVHDESIVPKHDAATGESWLHGRFTYILYRRTRGGVLPLHQVRSIDG